MDSELVKTELANLLTKSKAELASWTADLNDHIKNYGERPCDYLTNRRNVVSYYRGQANVLEQLAKKLGL